MAGEEGGGSSQAGLTLGWPWFGHPLSLGSGLDFCDTLIEAGMVCGHSAVRLWTRENAVSLRQKSEPFPSHSDKEEHNWMKVNSEAHRT